MPLFWVVFVNDTPDKATEIITDAMLVNGKDNNHAVSLATIEAGEKIKDRVVYPVIKPF